MFKLIADEILSPPATGGGSSFAHLTEDFDNGFLYSDIGLSLGVWDPGPGHADYSGQYVELTPLGGIRMDASNAITWAGELLLYYDQPNTSLLLGGAEYPGYRVTDVDGLLAILDTYQLKFLESGAAQPHFSINKDGSMHWGDGTVAPEVSMRRATGGGGLQVDGMVFVGDPDTVYSGLMSFGQLQTYRNNAADVVWQNGVVGENNRLNVHADGSFHWGNGTDPPDTVLKRLDANVLGNDDLNAYIALGDYINGIDSYTEMHVGGFVASDGATNTSIGMEMSSELGPLVGFHAVAGTVHLVGVSQGIVGILEDSGEIQLKSPNGTAYNIGVTNAGVLSVTAA